MSLVPCYECSKEISDKASVCPSCGAPRGKGWFKDYYEDRPLLREGGHFRGQRDGKYKEYFENEKWLFWESMPLERESAYGLAFMRMAQCGKSNSLMKVQRMNL